MDASPVHPLHLVLDKHTNLFTYLIHDKGRPPGILVFFSHAYLKDGAVFSKNGVQFFGRNGIRQIPYIQDAIDFGWKFGLPISHSFIQTNEWVPDKKEREKKHGWMCECETFIGITGRHCFDRHLHCAIFESRDHSFYVQLFQ